MQRKFSKTVVGWACQRLIDIHQWYAGCKFFRDQHMTWRIIGFNHRDRRGFIADDLLQRLFCRIFFGNGHKWCDHLLKRRTKRHLTRKYWKDSYRLMKKIKKFLNGFHSSSKSGKRKTYCKRKVNSVENLNCSFQKQDTISRIQLKKKFKKKSILGVKIDQNKNAKIHNIEIFKQF